MVFESMAHEEDYRITRVKNIGKAQDIILGERGITDMFTADIVVLKNGKQKKYSIKDKEGNIIHIEGFNRKDYKDLDDEYFIQSIKK